MLRPTWIGCGIFPLVSQVRQVRSDVLHIAAASAGAEEQCRVVGRNRHGGRRIRVSIHSVAPLGIVLAVFPP